MLSSGESSRLNQSLVYRQRIATQAGFSADLRVGPGLLVAYAIAAGGKSPAEVGAALLAEVSRLASAPPSAAELAKVKTQLVTQASCRGRPPLGLASAIADAAVLEGDAARVNTDLDDLQRVSAADVQRVMRSYVRRRPQGDDRIPPGRGREEMSLPVRRLANARAAIVAWALALVGTLGRSHSRTRRRRRRPRRAHWRSPRRAR